MTNAQRQELYGLGYQDETWVTVPKRDVYQKAYPESSGEKNEVYEMDMEGQVTAHAPPPDQMFIRMKDLLAEDAQAEIQIALEFLGKEKAYLEAKILGSLGGDAEFLQRVREIKSSIKVIDIADKLMTILKRKLFEINPSGLLKDEDSGKFALVDIENLDLESLIQRAAPVKITWKDLEEEGRVRRAEVRTRKAGSLMPEARSGPSEGVRRFSGKKRLTPFAFHRAEVRSNNWDVSALAKSLLRSEVRLAAERYTGKLLRERFRAEYGGAVFTVMVRQFLGEEAFAEPARVKREIFDYRKAIPRNPAELNAMVLFAAQHPDVRYHLILAGAPEEADALRSELRGSVRGRRPDGLPDNFSLEAFSQASALAGRLRHGFDAALKSGIPAAFVTEDPALAQTGYRPNLLRVVGSRDAVLQNASVLSAAERLLGELRTEELVRTHRGEDLDPNHWNSLVARLRKFDVLSSSA